MLTPAGDAQGLLDTVVLVSRDAALTDELGARGRQFALDQLSRRHALDAYDSWVEGLLEATAELRAAHPQRAR